MGTSMPPPPTDTPVAGVGSGSEGDKLKGFLVNLTGGGMPMVRQQLEDAHAKRVAEADRNHRSYGELSQVLAGDTTGKYMGKDGTLTPEGQKLELQRKAAFDAWQKAAGVSKENKSIIGKLGQFTDKLVHHRAGGNPPQPGQGGQGQQPATGMPQPPQNAAPAGGEGAKGGSGMPVPPNASPDASGTQMPPPPGYTPAGQDPGTSLARSQAESAHQVAQSDLDDASQRKQEEEKVRGEYSVKAAQARVKPHPVTYSDPNDPTKRLFGTQDLTTGQVFDQNGEPVENAGQILPGTLPTVSSSSSTYNPDTGTTTSSRTTQKVPPRGKSGMPAPPTAKSGRGPSTAKGGGGGRVAAMADDWEQNGVVPSSKDKPAVEKYLKDQGRNAPVTLIPEAQKTIIAASPVMDQIDGLLKDINDLKLGNNNSSGYLLGPRAKYAIGIASPEGSLGKDIAGLSLGSVVEAASVLKGTSRSVLALKKALEHTPNPWVDSPKLMKEKLETIKARLKDVMDDAYKYGKKGAAVGYGDSHMPKPPQTADEEAAAYLAKHAAAH
jgi:hypothetical protein